MCVNRFVEKTDFVCDFITDGSLIYFLLFPSLRLNPAERNHADLVGFPFQIRIGLKKLKEGKVEFYDRATRVSEDVVVDDAVRLTKGRIDAAKVERAEVGYPNSEFRFERQCVGDEDL
jgi:hypothetical protein